MGVVEMVIQHVVKLSAVISIKIIIPSAIILTMILLVYSKTMLDFVLSQLLVEVKQRSVHSAINLDRSQHRTHKRAVHF